MPPTTITTIAIRTRIPAEEEAEEVVEVEEEVVMIRIRLQFTGIHLVDNIFNGQPGAQAFRDQVRITCELKVAHNPRTHSTTVCGRRCVKCTLGWAGG